jgi:small GTP-binding protein
MASDVPHYKVVLLGNSGVGKTALVERASEDIFRASHVPTVGAQFISLELQAGGHPCVLELWDTAGQEVFRSLVGFYARDAMGAFVLFDVTTPKSFDDLGKWFEFIGENAPDAKIIIFGNKIDLADTREIGKAQAQELADKRHVLYYEGSAKTGETVNEAFDRMTEILASGGSVTQTTIKLDSDPKKKKTCC